ncbi:putative aldouronate transport system substrate-binding protein [Paenibacillus phyllosphaerae]|uniref:Putative aldouronate transport system substrate-binding protein n=1 Tax=Paenibacillus phyllosphaerae TaxID=274593 RepID=A0A7W5FM41_9BACL|nr:extracellular solute-binding protein [Paenibacillus phyllosphaerae]MBB3109677.1 putative aldouronate transport system substrate-binding protein [Paenibacillus phyllosphaerae]
MKKSLWVSLMVVLISSIMLSACSGGGNTEENGASATNGGEASESAGPVEVTFFAPQGKAPLEDNDYTKLVEEKFNVKIKWDLAPTDALNDRRQLLLASGDYPEVFLEGKFSNADLVTYGKQGVLLPLNDLIDQYAPNLKAMMEKKPYLKEAMVSPDGNIYGIPRLNECYHCTHAQKFWINKEWLDKVGLAIPTTTDELYTVLKAFKTQDPNGNGKADEIPLTGAPDKSVWNGNVDAFLMNAFIYNDNSKYLTMTNGKVDFAANKPEWKEGLTYMHKLYSEGLIDPASFTQNDQAVSQLGKREGEEIVGSITTALLSYLVDTYDDNNERQKHWVIVPPLKGPNGVQLAGTSMGLSEFAFAITNKASEAQQIAAMKIVDYAFSEEGSLYSEYGPTEGIGWNMAGADEKNVSGGAAKYTFENLKPQDENVVRNDSWSLLGPKDLSKEFRDLFATAQDPLSGKGYEKRLADATSAYTAYAPKEVYPSTAYIRPEDTDAAAQLTTAIKDYVMSNMAQFIIGNKDIEKDWDAYVKGFDGLNLAKYIEIYQAAIAKQ